jgi:hypothetical protein
LLSPAQGGGLVNAIPKAYIEIDGQIEKEGANGNWLRKLTFREINGPTIVVFSRLT